MLPNLGRNRKSVPGAHGKGDGETLALDGDPDTRVTVKRSSRARRVSLRVSRLDGRISLTLPVATPLRHGEAFLNERAEWVRRQLEKATPGIFVGELEAIPFAGQETPLIRGNGRAVKWQDKTLIVPSDPSLIAPRLLAFFKQCARTRFADASADYSAVLGQGFRKITVRDTKSRWGSCTSDGNLMFSWRLIMAPPDVLDYVVAHEICHLKHMDHSPRFWALVDKIYGPCQDQKRWLRKYGPGLHAYKFKSGD